MEPAPVREIEIQTTVRAVSQIKHYALRRVVKKPVLPAVSTDFLVELLANWDERFQVRSKLIFNSITVSIKDKMI